MQMCSDGKVIYTCVLPLSVNDIVWYMWHLVKINNFIKQDLHFPNVGSGG